MHIISRKRLKEAAERHPNSSSALDTWYRIAKKEIWSSLADVRATYSSADGVTAKSVTYTVFNIGGNKLRLISEINYRTQTVYIRHVMTHEEYDEGGWKK